MGLARNGSYAGNSSGDIFIAFSTANAAALEETAGTGLRRGGGGQNAATESAVKPLEFLPGEHMGEVRSSQRRFPKQSRCATLLSKHRCESIVECKVASSEQRCGR